MIIDGVLHDHEGFTTFFDIKTFVIMSETRRIDADVTE